MKRFLGTVAAMTALIATSAAADFTLTVLHTNDFHARFEPIRKYDSGCSAEDNAEGKCFGGSARLMSAVTEARARRRLDPCRWGRSVPRHAVLHILQRAARGRDDECHGL